MQIKDIIITDEIEEKLIVKHSVLRHEVEELLRAKPGTRYWWWQKGFRKDEDVYMALGQTEAGRYLICIFIYKKTRDAFILSTRDMEKDERKRYHKK